MANERESSHPEYYLPDMLENVVFFARTESNVGLPGKRCHPDGLQPKWEADAGMRVA